MKKLSLALFFVDRFLFPNRFEPLFSEETSGANVYIDKEYSGVTDSNALCVICGKSEQVEIAKEMIFEKLNQFNSSNAAFPIQLDPAGSIIGTPPSDARSDTSINSGVNYHSPLSRSFNRYSDS